MKRLFLAFFLACMVTRIPVQAQTKPSSQPPYKTSPKIPGAQKAPPPLPSCPAIVNNAPPDLDPPGVTVGSLKLPTKNDVPASIARTAERVVGSFERDGGDPWKNVSTQDTISIGFMQWTWGSGSGSLIDTLLKEISDADISLAADDLQTDLKSLKAFSKSPEDKDLKEAARAVIASWKEAEEDDPLVGGVRKSVRDGLQDWLGSKPVKAAQQRLVDRAMQRAYAYASAWRRDIGSKQPPDERLVTYFFDLVTFNGGIKGVWVPHVRKFREGYADGPAAVTAVSDWLRSCKANERMYNFKDGIKSADYWARMVKDNPKALSEEQVDLLVHGLIRAHRSDGDDDGAGFPGIFQADVLTRRGVLAVGSGYIRGSSKPRQIF